MLRRLISRYISPPLPAIVKIPHLNTIALHYADGSVHVLPQLQLNTRLTIANVGGTGQQAIRIDEQNVAILPGQWAKPFSEKMLSAYATVGHMRPRPSLPIMPIAIGIVLAYVVIVSARSSTTPTHATTAYQLPQTVEPAPEQAPQPQASAGCTY